MAVATKARLDSIAVKGDCDGCEAPAPGVDIIVIVDGSDSYNSKAEVAGSITEGGAYGGTIKALQKYFFSQVPDALPGTNNTALIQFSGNKQLEGSYKPGSDGQTSTPAIQHWKWEMEPTELTNDNHKSKTAGLEDSDTLDGNGQLYLCLQDLTLPNCLDKQGMFKSSNKKVIVVITDEEWDIKKLQDPSGKKTTSDAVIERVHKAGYFPYAVIVRPNADNDLNEDTIKKLTGAEERYFKVYTNNFENQMKKALNAIIADLKE